MFSFKAGTKHSLFCRVIELVLSWTPEAGLNARVSPESFHDGTQLHTEDHVICVAGNCEQLPRISLTNVSNTHKYSLTNYTKINNHNLV